jgi:hypothetical protein
MDVSTSPKVTIGPGVQEFLRKNGAETSFQAVCDVIRACLPETLAIDAELGEDYDECGWWRVLVLSTLPAATPVERVVEQERLFHERCAERIPPEQRPLFVTQSTFAPE